MHIDCVCQLLCGVITARRVCFIGFEVTKNWTKAHLKRMNQLPVEPVARSPVEIAHGWQNLSLSRNFPNDLSSTVKHFLNLWTFFSGKLKLNLSRNQNLNVWLWIVIITAKWYFQSNSSIFNMQNFDATERLKIFFPSSIYYFWIPNASQMWNLSILTNTISGITHLNV